MNTIPTLPGVSSHFVDTDRLRVHVLRSGPTDGVPVLFIHGNVSSAAFWEETMQRLPAGHQAIALDLRGYGFTEPAPIDATLGMDDHVADVRATVQALGLDAVHVVAHSMGGGIAMKYVIAHGDEVRSLTLVDPVSPYGYGGSKGVDGAQTFEDGGPCGVNPDFVATLQAKDTGLDNPMSPRNVFRAFYVKPPFVPAREDDLIASMLTTRIGDDHYPGTISASENWPGAAPGERGVLSSFSRKYFDASALSEVAQKPPVLWVRGADDQIVADLAMFDLAALGQVGAVPGWPGAEVCPAQPMLQQTRAVLDRYAAAGGEYQEVVIADAAHSPYLEQPEAFDAAFHALLNRS